MERMLNFEGNLGEGRFFIDFHSQDSQTDNDPTEDTQNKAENSDNGKFIFLKRHSNS